MKPNRLTKAAILGFSLLVLAGCLNPLGGSGDGATESSGANLAVTISTLGASSVIPDVAALVASYTLTLSRDGFSDLSASGGETTFEFTGLPPGPWDILIEARDNGDRTIGRGTGTVELTEDRVNSVTIPLAPTTDGTGTIDLTITWPQGLIDELGGATVAPLGGAAVEIGSRITGLPEQARYSAEHASGVYELLMRFDKDGVEVAALTVAVHVYDNVATTETVDLTGGEIGQPPAPPTDLSATAGQDQVTLTWTDTSPVNDNYEVQRKMEGESAWQDLATLGATAVEYVDTGAAGGASYSYRIRATNAYGPALPTEGWLELNGVEPSTVILVTTGDPAGPGSLGAALSTARSGDNIVFDNDYTVTAPATLPTAPNWFSISESVTIDAEGHAIVLDANAAGRHFHVQNPATLTLRSDPGSGGSFELRNGHGIDGASSIPGGSIKIDTGGALIAENVDFRDNRTKDGATTDAAGGAIFVGGSASITGGVFENNISDSWGGAINVQSGGLELRNVTFRENIAAEGVSGSSYGGGAINAAAGASVSVRGSHFEANSGNGGGAIRSAGSLTVSDASFVRNDASDSGGAIEAGMRGNTAKITGSEFYGNSADRGGAISSIFSGAANGGYGRVVVSSSIFVGNLVPYELHGAVMRSENWDTLVNVTLYNNGASSAYDAFSKAYTQPLEVMNSVIAINGWGDFVTFSNSTALWVNPVRVPSKGSDGSWGTADDDYGDLRLQSDSAAIGAGDNSVIRWDFADLDEDGDTTEPEPFDVAGEPRVVDGTVDQGAYEYQGD